MIMLVVSICSQLNGVCIIETPHKNPHFVPPFKTTKECKAEGFEAKDTFIKKYTTLEIPVKVKFRCINWGTPV